MHECSALECKRRDIGKILAKRELDVLVVCETKLKGKGKVMFGDVSGIASGE